MTNAPVYVLDEQQARDLVDAAASWLDLDRVDRRHRDRHSRPDRRRISRGLDARRPFPGSPALAAVTRELLATSRGISTMLSRPS